MPLILWIPKPLAFENMPQMTSAVVTDNFGPHHAEARVGFLSYRTRHSVPKCRPSAARVEFMIGLVEWGLAAGAFIDASVRVVLVVLGRAGHFSALFTEDAELFWRKLCLPFALGLGNGIVCVVCHAARRSKESAEEWDVWHRSVDDGTLWCGVEAAADGSLGVATDECAGCIRDGMKSADKGGEGREAHRGKVVI